MENRYLEKIAKMSLPAKAWVRTVLPALKKSSRSALVTANSKAKAVQGAGFHKGLYTPTELADFQHSRIMQHAKSNGLANFEANRAVKVATRAARMAQ